MKVLKDPDINRAIGFGLHFLKGMGKRVKRRVTFTSESFRPNVCTK